ncbi:MAG: adenosine deaminase family protein [Armatimonadota bacterium]
MLNITREQMLMLPKTDLHVHLDGSIDAKLFVELANKLKIDIVAEAKKHGIKDLITGSVEEINEKVFKKEYNNLIEYLMPFELVNCVLRTPETLEEVAYRFACDEFSEGVRYFEVRFAPQKHWKPDFGWEEIIKSVDKGLRRAMDEFNAKIKGELPYRCGMILCAMRMINPSVADYYAMLHNLQTGKDLQSLATMAAMEIAQLAVDSMKKGYLVVGFDLAGREDGYPAGAHGDAFEYCYNNGIQTTCHAGEAYGPESIMDAVKYCHARRIGHGTQLFRWKNIQFKNPDGTELTEDEKKAYVHTIAERLARERTAIEVCLKSNADTIPALRDLKNHPVKDFLKYNLRVALSTDNRAISRTTVTDEYMTLVKLYDIDEDTLRQVCIAGFKSAFYPGTYAEHRKYMHDAIDFYDETFKRITCAV